MLQSPAQRPRASSLPRDGPSGDFHRGKVLCRVQVLIWLNIIVAGIISPQFAPRPTLQCGTETCNPSSFQLAITCLKQKHDKACTAPDRLSPAVTHLLSTLNTNRFANIGCMQPETAADDCWDMFHLGYQMTCSTGLCKASSSSTTTSPSCPWVIL